MYVDLAFRFAQNSRHTGWEPVGVHLTYSQPITGTLLPPTHAAIHFLHHICGTHIHVICTCTCTCMYVYVHVYVGVLFPGLTLSQCSGCQGDCVECSLEF